VDCAFEGLGLRRIFAHHFGRSPASGRVMHKIGMRHEGTLRQHTTKWGMIDDLEVYGVLRGEVTDTA
jgi:ribosomal-protein-alanine N-acetyltransferase